MYWKDIHKEFGKGIEKINSDGKEVVICDMDEGYDIVFQKDGLVGGVIIRRSHFIAIQIAPSCSCQACRFEIIAGSVVVRLAG